METCHPLPLASGPMARVERCPSCGVVTVHLGALSLRLDADALQSVCHTLVDASAALASAAVPTLNVFQRGTA